MKKYFLLVIIIFSFSQESAGQSFGLEIFGGYSSYKMNDLTELLKFHSGEAVVPMKVTDKFPSRPNLGFLLFVSVNEIHYGLKYSYYSTGGRIHYKDYSGEVGLDMVLKANAIGMFTRFELLDSEKISLKASVGGSVYFSNGELKTFIIVKEESDKEIIELVSTSFALEPSLQLSYRIFEYVNVGFQIGAALDLGGDLHLAENKDIKLLDENDDPVKTDWSGIRAEVVIGFSF